MRDIRVCFFGDSLVAGVGDPTATGWVGRLVAGAFAAGTPVTAYNLGVRRETSADIRARWEAELAPRLTEHAECRVVFSFGANDATHVDSRPRVERAASVAHLERILAVAAKRSLSVLLVGPAPVGDDAQQERISALSLAFDAVAGRRDVPYVGIADTLRASPEYRREIEAGDGAHPGTAGYAQIAELAMQPWRHWLGRAVSGGSDDPYPAGRRARPGDMP